MIRKLNRFLIFVLFFDLNSYARTNPLRTSSLPRIPRVAVYFPVLIDSDFIKGSGLDTSHYDAFGGIADRSSSSISNRPPPMLPKATTTTEKLPLAQESHVVNNSVTEAPGPSYLTDSVYYHDPTPVTEVICRPRCETKVVEEEAFEVHLPNFSYTPQYLGESLDFNSLLIPALMHYIPMDSAEVLDQILQNSTETFVTLSTTQSPTIFTALNQKPITPEISTERGTILPLTSPSPSLFSRKPNRSRKIRFHPRRARPRRISRISVNLPTNSTSNKSRGLKSRVSERAKLTTTTVNPILTRISRPVVNPVHKRPSGESTTVSTVSKRIRLMNKQRTISEAPIFLQKSIGQRTPKPDRAKMKALPERQNSRLFDKNYQLKDQPRSSFQKVGKTPNRTLSIVNEAPVYRTSSKSYRAPSSLHQILPKQKTNTNSSHRDFIQTDANIYVPNGYNKEAIPGNAGIDYPIYATIPDTKFRCLDQTHSGLYADQDARCQVFHICQEDGREHSFLCPNGTVFNQQYFVCDWWFNFSCDRAITFYSLNAFIYEMPEESKKTKVS